MSSPEARTTSLLSRQDMLDSGLCIGCGVCVGAASGARMEFDRYGQMRPAGPGRWLHDRHERGFETLCPFSPFAANKDAKPVWDTVKWYREENRKKS